jgi:hypothetical protein
MLRRLSLFVLSFVSVIFYSGLSSVTAQVEFVKTIGTTSATSTGTSMSIAIPASGVAVGNRVILTLALNPAAGSVSCSDDGGNSYAVERNVRNGSGTKGVRIVILSAHVATALISGNTITCVHPNVTARAMAANEFSGLLATSAVDRKHSATGNNTTPSSGATAKTTQAAELLLGIIGVEGPSSESFSAGTNYTVVGRAGTNGGTATNNITINPEYRIVDAAAAYSATGTLGARRRWAAAIVTYKAAPATGPTKLSITSVNAGANPSAGVGFPVVVQAQDNGGAPGNVTANTSIILTLKSGSGTLGGTLAGTILAGTSQVTIDGATYTKAESGVVLTATRSSGDNLSSGDSTAFTVNPGVASALAFTTQPGNAPAGTSLPGPPTVAVRDSFGNNVTSSTASITVGIGTNPAGGILGGTTTRSAVSGVAGFTDLVISQTGTGYTLTASSAGLTAANSSAFSITAPTGSIIAGTVTRVSNGTAISGALVEAIQGSSVVASATTNASGNYSISGLSNGTYAVQASFAGFVPQIRTGVTLTGGATATVDLALNFGIAIHSPVSGTLINDHSVLVTGLFDTSLGEVGINVNGYVALQDGDEFATFVSVDAQVTNLTATVTDTSGVTLASHTIAITVQLPAAEPVLTFRPFPGIALVSQPVGFTLISLNEILHIELDGNGDGTIDFTGTTLDGVTVTFAEPGIYFPTVRVTDTLNTVLIDTAMVQVVNEVQLDLQLRAKWDAMKNALRSGNTAAAASYIIASKRTSYEAVFNNLNIPFSSIDQMVGDITYETVKGLEVEYEMLMDDGPDGIVSYMVLFSLDEDGVWRISFF